MDAPEQETCAYCDGSYPALVGLHHTEEECAHEQGLAKLTREAVADLDDRDDAAGAQWRAENGL